MTKIKIITILIVFLGSLSSFYFPDFGGLRLFEFISFFLLFFVVSKGSFQKVDRNLLVFFIGIICYAVISVIVSIANNVNVLYLNQFYGVIFTSFMSFYFFLKYKNQSDLLVLGVRYLIVIHTFFFLYQYVNFYFIGNYIDLIKPITGNTQRNIGGVFSGDTSIRASGLYGEPAAYALNIISFNFILLIKEKKLKILNLVSLVTILLSMSASGIIYLLLFVALYFLFYNKNAYLKTRLLFIFAILVIAALSTRFIKTEYLVAKIMNFKNSESYQYRIGNTFSDLMSFSDFEVLFGRGLGNLDIKYNKGSTYAIMLIEQGLVLGSVFFVMIFFLLKKFKVKHYNIAFIFVLFLGTHTFSQFQFWFLILSVSIVSSYNYINE